MLRLLDACSIVALRRIAKAVGVAAGRAGDADDLVDRLAAQQWPTIRAALGIALQPADLKVLCRRLGLGESGTAIDLVARISVAIDAGESKPSRWRSFEDARAFVHTLQVSSHSHWRTVTHDLPPDIPSDPHAVYSRSGWTSWGDFLGTGTQARRSAQYRSFEDARAYARALGLHSNAQWREHCRARTGNRRVLPPDVPAAPHNVYAARGWIGWGDFLGTGRLDASQRKYRSYAQARAFVRPLGITCDAEWVAYCRGGRAHDLGVRPHDIPTNPWNVYRGKGWVDRFHFWGGRVGRLRDRAKPFKAARAYVRALRLDRAEDWRRWWVAHRPRDLPAAPDQFYRDDGWISWGDFLGTGRARRGGRDRKRARKMAAKRPIRSRRQ